MLICFCRVNHMGYRKRTIITCVFFYFLLHFRRRKTFIRIFFFIKIQPFVWLVFKGGFKSRFGLKCIYFTYTKQRNLQKTHKCINSFWIYASLLLPACACGVLQVVGRQQQRQPTKLGGFNRNNGECKMLLSSSF